MALSRKLLRIFRPRIKYGAGSLPVGEVVIVLCLLCFSYAKAEEVWLEPESFIAQSFAGNSPKPKTLWFTGELRETVGDILNRKAPPRTKYWQQGNKTVWILEQIGKYKPITTGLVVENGTLTQLKVLIYRESHGWEVKYPFFTEQFIGVKLEDMEDHKLNKDIDGIAGATLSVRSLIRLARLALTLDHEVTDGTH